MRFKCLYIVLYVVCAVFVWQKSRIKCGDNEVSIENVEALASFEAMFGPGNKKIISEVTEHIFNHDGYRWSAKITCEENGRYGCEEGYYGKEKENDPWQRIG